MTATITREAMKKHINKLTAYYHMVCNSDRNNTAKIKALESALTAAEDLKAKHPCLYSGIVANATHTDDTVERFNNIVDLIETEIHKLM